jgi:hypothetical protein
VLVNPHDLPRVLASLATPPPGAASAEPPVAVVLPSDGERAALLDATSVPELLPDREDE